jgi:hypothetical protein
LNNEAHWGIEYATPHLELIAGCLYRQIKIDKGMCLTATEKIQGNPIRSPNGVEFSITISQASPNIAPIGLDLENAAIIEQSNEEQNGTDGLQVTDKSNSKSSEEIKWINPISIDGSTIGNIFPNPPDIRISEIKINNIPGKHATISFCKSALLQLDGFELSLHFKIYDDFPVIRKWIEIQNKTQKWLKISSLIIEASVILPGFTAINLTPSERGASASVMGLDHLTHEFGIILGAEIPSVLRLIKESGQVGYNSDHFEWILGPNENFVSEPVFDYGYSGKVVRTISAKSSPLDRAVERPFKSFLEQILQIPAATTEFPGPVFCTWSNYVANINDQNIRELADIAAQCGMKTFQLDAGWSKSPNPSDWTAGSIEPHIDKFPDFQSTCNYIRSKGLNLGLWLSCFRTLDSKDLKDMPDARMIPLVKRGNAFGMSYASQWRYYYANDVLGLVEKYHSLYFKQDLTNIKYGDFARTHDSRSRQESKLRGLRGLLESQSIIHQQAPNVWTLLSHEIYWGTPGVPCDLAAIKSACSFHIPPNDYSGAIPRNKVWDPSWKSPYGMNRWNLRQGCWNARRRYYAHRGLPLYTVEYYGAATINIDGTLTPEIQDRQICSFLMGIPSVYAGDLKSLTSGNIAHYKKRFDLLAELHNKYDIYRYFQYSGVPEPTEKGWHWWGKLNPDGYGVVVVIRGLFGSGSRNINIPWVNTQTQYRVRDCFKEVELGIFLGSDLQKGVLNLVLPRFGQTLLEIGAIS